MHIIVKSNPKRFFLRAHARTHTHTYIQFVLHCGLVRVNDIWRARHLQWRVFSFCIFCSYLNLHIVQGCRHLRHVNFVCHKATQVFTSAGHRDQELEALSQTVAHATACSTMLSPHCRYVMAVYHVEKHLVCLHIDGALITVLIRCSK
jgi:hypothetical protein